MSDEAQRKFREALGARLLSPAGALDVSIGDDVWIGSRVTIMAGVTIGTGAVIGAGAVVTKDVEPFSVVAGVPADHKRYRHDAKTISTILESAWWELEPDELFEACGSELTSQNAGQVARKVIAYKQRNQELSTDAPLAALSVEEIYEVLTNPSRDDGLPRWPAETVQLQYTGGSGVALLQRAANFISFLERDGAFSRPHWKGLDYGCGWGRIGSYLLTRGSATQLDFCDAWEKSLSLVEEGGFKNKRFKVSDKLKEDEIEKNRYDFIYAMSIFTHLDRATFENNLSVLVESLTPGGSLYFTVRLQRFLDTLIAQCKVGPQERLDKDGFWHSTYPNYECYGETVVSEQYMDALGSRYGEVVFLGTPEHQQNLFRIRKAS